MNTPMTPYQRLLAHFGGSVAKTAEHFHRTREAVRLWGINGMPEDLALTIEAATQGQVTAREVLESKQHAKRRAVSAA